MPYSPLLIKPMKEELTMLGVVELTTAEEVDDWMSQRTGTALLVVNSVCGCAAGAARPGVRIALQHEVTPDRVATVFAGQDVEATSRVRSHISDVPPSSPSMALFKEGELVYFVPRHRIEGKDAQGVAEDLTQAFDRYAPTAVATS